MDFTAKHRDSGLGPQTEKEMKELAAESGLFMITGTDDNRPYEERGIPTIRIAGGSAGLPLNSNMLRNMSQEARIAHRGQAFGVCSDGSLKPLSRPQDMVASSSTIRESFGRIFPRDLSLEKCSQTGNLWFTDVLPGCIQFSASRIFSNESILQSTVDGSNLFEGSDIPLYYSHVLFTYSPQIRFVANEKFKFALRESGPHLAKPFAEDESGRVPPTIRTVLCSMEFNGKEDWFHFLPPFCRDGNTLIFDKQFALADLKEHPKAKFRMSLYLYVHRSHFDLASIIDLDALPPTVSSDETARVVATILHGEKPSFADWEIMVAEASEGGDVPLRTFHVHTSAFSSISNRLETLFCHGYSVAKESIGVVEGEQRCSFPRLTATDMQVVIPLAYRLVVPLPTNRVPYVVESIRRIFNKDYLKDTLVPQWERLICKEALALDTKKVSSFSAFFRLLSIVWSFPRGWMPVAKRVAIGALADIVHLNAGDEVDKFIEDQYAEIRATATHCDDTEKWNEIIQSMIKHLYMVSSVLKKGPKQWSGVEDADDDQEQSEDVDDDEEWHDDEVHGGLNPADVKCQCAIS